MASSLVPLRASSDPEGLARAVCRVVVSTWAAACRIDLSAERMPPGLLPAGGATARSVAPDRPDLALAADDCGDASTRRRVVQPDPARDLAWICLPLSAERRVVGTLRIAVRGATVPPAHVVADAGHVAVSVTRALVEAGRRHEAVQVSRSLQQTLLPHSLPRGSWFCVAARYAPATAALQVGGDWYDAEAVRPDELALSVGDVAGHGVEAAARMGELRSAMTALRMVCEEPHQLIALLHRLFDGSPPTFATALCARLGPSGRFRWSSAGHLHPVAARHGTATILEGSVLPPLGAGPTGPAVLNECQLRPGDTVVLFTDGLVERRDEALDVSMHRLLVDIGSAPDLDPDCLLDHIVAARQRSGPTSDDIAVVAARLVDGHHPAG